MMSVAGPASRSVPDGAAEAADGMRPPGIFGPPAPEFTGAPLPGDAGVEVGSDRLSAPGMVGVPRPPSVADVPAGDRRGVTDPGPPDPVEPAAGAGGGPSSDPGFEGKENGSPPSP